MQQLTSNPRRSLIGGLVVLFVLATVLTILSPVRITISIQPDSQQAGAAPLPSLPTVTPPPPPTEEPTTEPSATATSAPPTNTSVPVTPTSAEPSATATSSVPTAISTMVPTETSEIPDEPGDGDDPDDDDDPTATPERVTEDDPTPQPPTATAIPTQVPPGATETPVPDIGTPNVVITKQASKREVRIGEQFSYTLTATNRGTAPAEGVVVTDAMPAQLAIRTVTTTQGEASVNGQSITVNVGTLAPEQVVTITILVEVRRQVQPGEIANLAMIFTTTPGDPPGDNTTTITVVIIVPSPAGAVPQRNTSTEAPPKLPTTANPDEALQLLMIFVPLVLLAMGLMVFGWMLRRNAFTQRIMVAFAPTAPLGASNRITTAQPSATADDALFETPSSDHLSQPQLLCIGEVRIPIDEHELYQQWKNGTSITVLVEQLTRHNPQVSKAALTIAVQQLLHACVQR
jgi:uncharacterized repeat protein (TIGR01451 family)